MFHVKIYLLFDSNIFFTLISVLLVLPVDSLSEFDWIGIIDLFD